MGMDQKSHTLWDRMVFEDGGKRENSCCFEVVGTVQEMILLFIGLLTLFGELLGLLEVSRITP